MCKSMLPSRLVLEAQETVVGRANRNIELNRASDELW